MRIALSVLRSLRNGQWSMVNGHSAFGVPRFVHSLFAIRSASLCAFTLFFCLGAAADWAYNLYTQNGALPVYIYTNAAVAGRTVPFYAMNTLTVIGAGTTNQALPITIVGAESAAADVVTSAELAAATNALTMASYVYDDGTLLVTGLTGNEEAGNGSYIWSGPEFAWFNGGFNNWEEDQFYIFTNIGGYCELYYGGAQYYTNDAAQPWLGTWAVAVEGVATNALVVSGLTGDETDGNGVYTLGGLGGGYENGAGWTIAWNDEAWAITTNATPVNVTMYTNNVVAFGDLPWGSDWEAVAGAAAPETTYAISAPPSVARAAGIGSALFDLLATPGSAPFNALTNALKEAGVF
jgi:hypothetical protein